MLENDFAGAVFWYLMNDLWRKSMRNQLDRSGLIGMFCQGIQKNEKINCKIKCDFLQLGNFDRAKPLCI